MLQQVPDHLEAHTSAHSQIHRRANMNLIANFFRNYPEAAIFLAIAIGVVLDRLKVAGFAGPQFFGSIGYATLTQVGFVSGAPKNSQLSPVS